ncbi:MAG: hypothetical protein LBU04_04760 [Christensenellaceae bacterium]|nr:hypothetical protein [Christensenellaceae bacterium]
MQAYSLTTYSTARVYIYGGNGGRVRYGGANAPSLFESGSHDNGGAVGTGGTGFSTGSQGVDGTTETGYYFCD